VDPRSIFGHVFTTEATIAIVVFGLVCFTLVFALVFSHARKRRDRPASRVDKNMPVEMGLAACFAGVAAFVIGLSFHSSAQEQTHGTAKDVIDVTAFQWCWKFGYPGHRISVTGDCLPGHRPTMVVPVGEPVTIRVRSTDVIHSWWVPELRYKMDAFPYHTNTFTIRIDRAGRWIGRCAEFCGQRHYNMDFWLKAVPRDQYQKWLASAGATA
jgi:cytochrome c oxidase subunit 2